MVFIRMYLLLHFIMSQCLRLRIFQINLQNDRRLQIFHLHLSPRLLQNIYLDAQQHQVHSHLMTLLQSNLLRYQSTISWSYAFLIQTTLFLLLFKLLDHLLEQEQLFYEDTLLKGHTDLTVLIQQDFYYSP